MASYVLTGFTSVKDLVVVGVSKDGHPVFGPYTSEGEERNCGSLDLCNGITETNGSYAYYLTTNFPYSVACFGPGTNPAPYTADCSTNVCTTLSNDSEVVTISFYMILALAMILMQ